MAQFVLDASALLALIQGERGAEKVIQALEKGACVVSAVNLSEAMTKLILGGLPVDEAEAVITGIPASWVPCDEAIAMQAARIATIGKPIGLSLGDRICLATGQIHGGTVLTTEQAWRKQCLEGVAIEIIRDPRPPLAPALPKGKGEAVVGHPAAKTRKTKEH